jgi:hypothetical protein
MTFRPELIDELLKDYRNPEDLRDLQKNSTPVILETGG